MPRQAQVVVAVAGDRPAQQLGEHGALLREQALVGEAGVAGVQADLEPEPVELAPRAGRGARRRPPARRRRADRGAPRARSRSSGSRACRSAAAKRRCDQLGSLRNSWCSGASARPVASTRAAATSRLASARLRRAAAPSTPRLLQRHGVSMSCVSATAKRAPPGYSGAARPGRLAQRAHEVVERRRARRERPRPRRGSARARRPGAVELLLAREQRGGGREIPRRVERAAPGPRRRPARRPRRRARRRSHRACGGGRRGATRRRGAPAHPTLAGCNRPRRWPTARASPPPASWLPPASSPTSATASCTATRRWRSWSRAVRSASCSRPCSSCAAARPCISCSQARRGVRRRARRDARDLGARPAARDRRRRAARPRARRARRSARRAAWIVALSPVALYYGDFARMYSLFLAFSALALWCLVRALDTDEPRFWAATAVLLVLNTYTHPYGVVVGLIAALAVLAELLQARERAAWRRAAVRRRRRDRGHGAARHRLPRAGIAARQGAAAAGHRDPEALARRRRRAGRRALRRRAARRRADRRSTS